MDDSKCYTSTKDEACVDNVSTKPLVKHMLTEKMQLYYTKVTEVIKGDDFELQRAAFSTLVQDPGIHQLLPNFSRFIYEEVKHSNHDLSLLFSLMQACRYLLTNQNVYVKIYVRGRARSCVLDESNQFCRHVWSCVNLATSTDSC